LEKTLLVVVGPTAVGKTAAAIQVAQHFNTEIISADSRQFYQELSIGVARPSQLELDLVKHHFIADVSVNTPRSAGDFAAEAEAKIQSLFEKKDLVVCAGGSGLYVDALLFGLDDLPSDAALREQLNQEFSIHGLHKMQEKLRVLDPVYFMEVDISNAHRLVRAIEICLLTGKPYSELRTAAKTVKPYRTVVVGLTGEREWLYQRINTRVEAMMEAGLEEEARKVYPRRHLNALNTVGYKELFSYFDGTIDKATAIGLVQQHTRQFAKRQLTWWKKKEHIRWLSVDQPHDVLQFVRQVLG
jgi:tRNA dimethylallyltransferase